MVGAVEADRGTRRAWSYAAGVSTEADFGGRDDDRVVELEDDTPVLPDQTREDTDRGWGERSWSNDDRLRDERPPHWD
ncbi:hypothetical protein Cci01nite_23640 [Catellatospora citrea]|uniref:Uncharacterized protein n=1 Tax=Catellatospora citrea TaxID=53366 RepID=A0A8J3NYA5_9ACTN|nr:hypothetical protein C8E86_4199 [Catellatospora citrea]GIF97270.1 hypothetical protein Cci01nite_23640 [Catellatospora citrea]